ncbi:hypothetical protein ACF0H5_004360 [Mactra antiquata]
MEELLKNSAVRSKIQGLSPPVKKAFIESLLDLYEQETEEMIDVIEESRMELRGDYRSFQDETQNLRAESRMLEDKRKDHDNQCVDQYLQTRASRVSESRMSFENENSKSVKDYIKKRGKRGPPLAEEIKRSQSSTDRYSSKPRPDSVMTTRSLPTPATLRTVEEEKDEVMKNLSSANQQNEVERQRQAELIAQRREKRRMEKKTTEEKALELLEKAVAMDKMLQEKKMEQEQMLRARLEDAKRKRAESRLGGPVVNDETLNGSSNDKVDDKKDEKKSDDKHKRKSSSENKDDDKQKHRSSSDRHDKDKHRSKDTESKERRKESDNGKDKDRKRSESRSDDKHKDKSSEHREDRHKNNDKRSDSSDKRKSEKKPERKSSKDNDKKNDVVDDYDFSIY